MPIAPKKPITIPAKTADKLWVTYFNVSAFSPSDPIRVFIRLAPYISAENKISTDMVREIEIPDMYAAAAEDPVLANAINVLFSAIEKLAGDKKLFEETEPTEPPPQYP